MGLLARDMQEKQVRELLAVLPTSCISQTEREDCTTAIRFFVLLKKRMGTDKSFLTKLESLLEECKCEDFLSTIKKFKEENPDLLASDSISTLNLPNGTKAGFKPKRGQSDKFRSILLRISRTFPRKHLEIMVALPPIPEAEKQNITEGHDLFHQMERHGCISENDTEMLEEILELFSLTDAIKYLTEYQNEFPPIIHNPRPSAPIYASPSVSMQAQHGIYSSLPPFLVGRHPSQYQSSHPSPQSLPISTSHEESGEHNLNNPSTRHFVASQSPPYPHHPIGETVQTFPREGSAPSPPDHTPSSTGSNDTYPRPHSKKRPRLSESMPPPSKVLRPLDQHTGDGCFFSKPAGARANRRESEKSSSSQAETMSISTVSSYTGDSDKFNTAVSAGRPVNPSTEGGQLSLNTLESYTAEHSFASVHHPGDIQHPPPPQHNPIHHPGGIQHPPPPQHNPVHHPGDIQHLPPPQHNSAAHSVPLYEAESLNVPEGQQCEPSLPSHPDASGGLPSNVSSLPTFSSESNFSAPSQAQQQPENGSGVSLGSGHVSRAQFRNVPGSPGVPQPARDPDDLAYQLQGGNGHQPFYHQASYSTAVVPPSWAPSAVGGASLSSSSYQGPSSSVFPSMIPEAPESTYSSVPKVSPNHNLVMSKTTAKQAYKSGDFVSQNEPVTTGAVIAKNITPFGGESQSPGSSLKHHQRSSQAHNKPATPSRKRPVVLKNERQNVHKAAEFESLNQSVGGTARLTQYQQQLYNFRQRYAAGVPSHAQVSEQGLPIAQASSLRNVDIQGETLKEEEKQQSPSAAENVFYGASLYPSLPSLDTSTGTTGATQTGTKRGRAQNQLPEGLEDKEGGEKEEEEPSVAKRQKTDKRVTRSETKKRNIFSRVVGYFGSALFGSGKASNDTGDSSSDEQLQQERSESESEYHDAEEY